MVRENLIIIYNQKRMEEKGFALPEKMQYYRYETAKKEYEVEPIHYSQTNIKPIINFIELFSGRRIGEGKYAIQVPDFHKGLNYIVENKKMKIIPVNIYIYDCEDIKKEKKGNVNEYWDFEGIDKDTKEIVNEKKIKEKEVKFFEKISGNNIRWTSVKQEFNKFNVNKPFGLYKKISRFSASTNLRDENTKDKEYKIIREKSKVYNVPEKDWMELWENAYYSNRLDVITRRTADIQDNVKILEKDKIISYDYKGKKEDFSSPIFYEEFIIENAKKEVDTKKIRSGTLTITNSDILDLKINEKVNKIKILNSQINNLSELLRKNKKIKEIRIRDCKARDFSDLVVRKTIMLQENYDCEFGNLQLTEEGEVAHIIISDNKNIRIGEINVESAIKIERGKIDKIGNITCRYIKILGAADTPSYETIPNATKGQPLIIPNEIFIKCDSKKENKYIYKFGEIEIGGDIEPLDASKPLIFNLDGVGTIKLDYNKCKNMIFNISSFKNGWNIVKEDIYFPIKIIKDGTDLSVFCDEKIPKYSIQKEGFDIVRFLQDRNIKVFYKGKEFPKKIMKDRYK